MLTPNTTPHLKLKVRDIITGETKVHDIVYWLTVMTDRGPQIIAMIWDGEKLNSPPGGKIVESIEA